MFILGGIPWNKNKKGGTSWNKGKKHSLETRRKMSESHKGMLGKCHSEETKKRISISKIGKPSSRKGITLSLETRKRISNSKRLKSPIFYKYSRDTMEYREWRNNIYKRDNYTCQICGQKGGDLNADHIQPICFYPELIFNINNGRTLCVDCHKKTDTYGIKIYHIKRQTVTT